MVFPLAGLRHVLSVKNCARPYRFPFIVSGVKRYVTYSLYLDFPNFFAFGLVSFDLCLCNSVIRFIRVVMQ